MITEIKTYKVEKLVAGEVCTQVLNHLKSAKWLDELDMSKIEKHPQGDITFTDCDGVKYTETPVKWRLDLDVFEWDFGRHFTTVMVKQVPEVSNVHRFETDCDGIRHSKYVEECAIYTKFEILFN